MAIEIINLVLEGEPVSPYGISIDPIDVGMYDDFDDMDTQVDFEKYTKIKVDRQ